MSKPFNKYLCECDGKGWFVNQEQEWDLCLAGCLPPERVPTVHDGVLAMARYVAKQNRKAVA